MKKVLFTITLLLYFSIVLANDKKENAPFFYKNSVALEKGGSNVIYALKYERILLNYPRYKTSSEIGTGLFNISLGVNQLISFHQHHVQLGANAVLAALIFEDRVYYSFAVGYRFQKPTSRFGCQASLLLLYGQNMGLHPWPGIAIRRGF